MSQAPDATNSSQPSEAPMRKPCAGGCGFFGSPDTMDYCSVCYKSMVPEEQQKKNEVAKQEKANNDSAASNSASQPSTDNPEKSSKKVQKKKNRCWNCRKKIALAARFECKCGYIFCSLHRFPDAHECDFDHKKAHMKKLEDDNIVVAPSKLEKI